MTLRNPRAYNVLLLFLCFVIEQTQLFRDVLGKDLFHLKTNFFTNLMIVALAAYGLLNARKLIGIAQFSATKDYFSARNLSAFAFGLSGIFIYWAIVFAFPEKATIHPNVVKLVKHVGLFPITPLIEDLFFWGFAYTVINDFLQINSDHPNTNFVLAFVPLSYWFVQAHSFQTDFFNAQLPTITRFYSFPTAVLLIFLIQGLVFQRTKFLPYVTFMHYLSNGIVYGYFKIHNYV